jgi:hypothetical protein
MATPPEDWTCSICYEDYPSSEKYCKIPDEPNNYFYRACATCLRTQFLSAQENEISYPVKWQKQILHPRQFPSAFNGTFVRAYEAKEREYKTPALERVYCECGTFVAPMVDENARMSWNTLASSKLCPGCEARWCLRCAQRCGGFGVPHECVPERRLGERRLALGGLKKGKDFQLCPAEGCGRTIELAEACNAMTCQCGTDFCYICGEQADPESDHWLRVDGGCPRYGVVGSGRAIFDDDLGPAMDEANAEAAFAMEEREVWERGEGESTTFDFIRWAWQATMFENDAYVAQLDIMFGNPGADEEQAVDEVHRAMEMYHSVSHSGVSEEQWQELVEQHTNAAKNWLRGLQFFVGSSQGSATDLLGGALLDYPPDHMFNMAVPEDREAAAVWVEQASATTTEWTLENGIELPGSAVFDVGPGGAPGESWRIRDTSMFDDVPALGLFKLAGGALLVVPRPWQVAERRVEDGFLEGGLFGVFGLPTIDSEDEEGADDEAAEEETAEDEAAEDNDAVNKTAAAGDETAEDDAAQDVTAEDETAAGDEPAGDDTAEDRIAKLDQHEANVHSVTKEQLTRKHGDFIDPGKARADEQLYSNNLRLMWYSEVYVAVTRGIVMLVCWLLVYSCYMDWQTIVRGQ